MPLTHKQLWIVAACLLIVSAGLYAYLYLTGESHYPADELTHLALTASTPESREQAALNLAGQGPEALPQMRRVLAESNLPVVRAAMCQSLGSHYDFESMPILLSLLEDDSDLVRWRAGIAVTTILGIDFHYRSTEPPALRDTAIRKMKLCYDSMRRNPPPKYRRN